MIFTFENLIIIKTEFIDAERVGTCSPSVFCIMSMHMLHTNNN